MRSEMWLDHREVVRDEQVGEVQALLQVDQQVDDLRLDVDVERRDRLVGDDELGRDRERARDRDALPLAARELVRKLLRRARARPDQRQQLVDARAQRRLVGRETVKAHRLGENLRHRHARIERRVRVLEDHLHPPAQRPHLRRRGERDVAAVEAHRARIRRRGCARSVAPASTCRTPIRRPARRSRRDTR